MWAVSEDEVLLLWRHLVLCAAQESWTRPSLMRFAPPVLNPPP